MDFVLPLYVDDNNVLMVRYMEEAERWLRDTDMVLYSMLCASIHRAQHDRYVCDRDYHGQRCRVPL